MQRWKTGLTNARAGFIVTGEVIRINTENRRVSKPGLIEEANRRIE